MTQTIVAKVPSAEQSGSLFCLGMRYEKGTFITVPNKVQMRSLTLGARAVFIEMCEMSDDNGVCFPSRKLLGERIQMSQDSVDRFIEELLDGGFITKTHRKGEKGNYTSNLYQIMILEGVAAPMPLPSRTHTATPSRTHAHLTVSNRTKPTEERAFARPAIVEITTSLEEESGDSKSPRISGDKKKAYDELIAWSENERGFAFPKTTKLKQYRAFKLANENKITRDQLIERWEEMSTKKFWQENGFDWMNVVQDLLKKPV